MGGENHYEYVLAGAPMLQIAIAEPLAKPGETVLSPEAWHFVKNDVEGGIELGCALEDCVEGV
eukprot:1170843-Prorocentrum_minimum.AAC.1